MNEAPVPVVAPPVADNQAPSAFEQAEALRRSAYPPLTHDEQELCEHVTDARDLMNGMLIPANAVRVVLCKGLYASGLLRVREEHIECADPVSPRWRLVQTCTLRVPPSKRFFYVYHLQVQIAGVVSMELRVGDNDVSLVTK